MNFTIPIAERIITARVVKIAIPPPSATVLSENLSLAGLDTKPVCKACFRERKVNTSDNANEPASNAIDINNSEFILITP